MSPFWQLPGVPFQYLQGSFAFHTVGRREGRTTESACSYRHLSPYRQLPAVPFQNVQVLLVAMMYPFLVGLALKKIAPVDAHQTRVDDAHAKFLPEACALKNFMLHYCSEWVKKGIIGTMLKHAGKMASLNSLS